MPVVVLDPDRGEAATGTGDVIVVGQAAVLKSRREKVELDVGVELTLPTGSASLLAGSTAVRPFVSGAIRLGPLELIANLSHQWVVAGPVSGVQLFQANAALGYPLDRVTPFVELSLIQPVQRIDDHRPVTGPSQFPDNGRSNETGAAGNEKCLHRMTHSTVCRRRRSTVPRRWPGPAAAAA